MKIVLVRRRGPPETKGRPTNSTETRSPLRRPAIAHASGGSAARPAGRQQQQRADARETVTPHDGDRYRLFEVRAKASAVDVATPAKKVHRQRRPKTVKKRLPPQRRRRACFLDQYARRDCSFQQRQQRAPRAGPMRAARHGSSAPSPAARSTPSTWRSRRRRIPGRSDSARASVSSVQFVLLPGHGEKLRAEADVVEFAAHASRPRRCR